MATRSAKSTAAKTTTESRSPLRTKAPKADSPDNWDQRLGFLMHDVSRLRRTVFDGLVRPVGVTRSQWWVLAYLARHDGMIQSDLAGSADPGRTAQPGEDQPAGHEGPARRRWRDIRQRGLILPFLPMNWG